MMNKRFKFFLHVWRSVVWAVPLLLLMVPFAKAAPPVYPQNQDAFKKKAPGVDRPLRTPHRGKENMKAKPVRTGQGSLHAAPSVTPLAIRGIPGFSAQQTVRPLVLLLSFSDNAFSTTDAASYPAFLFSNPEGPPEPDRTLAEYYGEVSGGALSITGDPGSVIYVDFMSAGLPSYEYYVNGQSGQGAYPSNTQGMVEDALVLADAVVNFADFDNDGPDGVPRSFGSPDDDGLLDALVVIHAGPAAEYFPLPQYDEHLVSQYWSFQTVIGGVGGARIHDGVRVLDWAIVPARDPDATDYGPSLDRGTSETYQQTLGTLAHEFGHILGLPDLYDTDGSSYGLGHYGLMSYGTYGIGTYDNLSDPSKEATWDRPAFPSAWEREYMGWVQPAAVHADTVFGLWRAEDSSETVMGYPQIVKVWTSSSWVPGVPWDPSEYFLLEHRQSAPGTYDLGFNYDEEGGVLIYHVDRSVLLPGGTLDPNPNDNENLKGVDLEEGDTGGQELDNKVNFGDWINYPTGPNDGDFFGGSGSDFWLGSLPDSRDNSQPPQPTGISIVDGFSTFSSASSADYLMTVDMKSYKVVATNGIGYSGTDRAGPFVVSGGTFDDGDGDPWITAGQEVQLQLEVRHAGIPNTARGVRAVIDSPDFASVSNSSVFYGDLPALAQSTGDGDFVFTLSEPPAAFAWVPVYLTIVDTNNNLSSEEILLPVVAPPNVAPFVTIVSGPPPVGKGTAAAFTWSGTDPDGTVSGYFIGMDSVGAPSTWTTATSTTYNDLAAGDHVFSIKAVDDDGAESGIVEWAFTLKRSGGGGGPCFIATALWGSDNWRTDRLRDFRDQYMMPTATGRHLVELYYRHSPAPAAWLQDHPGPRGAVSVLLRRLLWPFFL